MSDNIVTFRGKTEKPKEPEERLIYVCSCGCRTFNLYADGNIVCSYCDGELGPGAGDPEGWRRCLQPPPPVVEKDDGGTLNEHQLPDSTLARRSVMKKINQWADSGNLVMVYAYHENGAGSGWMDISSDEQKEWMLDKLQDVVKFVTDWKVTNGADEGTETREMDEGRGENKGIPQGDGPEVG
jgi:hypothetical protein